jgi:hypothetical protein
MAAVIATGESPTDVVRYCVTTLLPKIPGQPETLSADTQQHLEQQILDRLRQRRKSSKSRRKT